ncbi:MAG: aminotransferase class III-fold pyridoxal phosphate-dependent enzyme, partial [Candidatus Methanofastidiosia archaeon]
TKRFGWRIYGRKEYLKEVRRICSENNVLLIFDESQTAFGRCGEMFASLYYKVEPDLMCLTKALGGGFPIGATLAGEDLIGFTPAEEHTTFGSNPIMFAAALINIEVCERLRLPEKAKESGAYITKRLKELSESYEMIGDVRGPGLFIGVELVKNSNKKRAIHETEDFIKLGFKKGVIFGRSMPDERAGMIYDDRMITGGNVVKIKPPLVITEEEADFVLQVFEECLKTLKG